jgi:hypothetical protein
LHNGFALFNSAKINHRQREFNMSLEYGFVATFAIVGFGGVGLAGFVLWLRFQEGA